MEEGKLKKIGLIKLITEFWKVSVFKIENVNWQPTGNLKKYKAGVQGWAVDPKSSMGVGAHTELLDDWT